MPSLPEPQRSISDADAERGRIATILCSFGIPEAEHTEYLAEIDGLIGIALDAYFAELRDGK
jgi:hypothetical protein